MKQTLKIGITLVVVATLAMSGIALAQVTTDDTAPAVEDTRAYQGIQDKLAPLVEDGTISQAQADAVATALAEGMRRGPGGGRGFRAIQQVAEFLELSDDELKAAIEEYDTIAEIAEANGSSADEVVAYLLDQLEEHLATAVDDGRLTQDEADERLADAEEHLTEMVNSDIPERPLGGRGPGGRGPGGRGIHTPGTGGDA